MRHQLKPKNPSARARMHYILRSGRYGVNQSRVDELVVAGVANLPAWASGPEDFWAGTDGFERANARLSLEIELNLPRELSREGQVAAVADYIDRLTTEAGAFPITWALHDSGDGNPHVHLMLQERPLDGVDRDGPKAHFKRANKKKPLTGGVAKSEWWHKPAHVFWSRALWADACNQQLLAEGHTARFDPRKKSERLDEALRAGDLRAAAVLCTQTERHEGVRVAAARKRLEGGWIEPEDLPDRVVQIISGNDQARGFNCWLRDWARTASEKELKLFLADHLHELHQTLAREMHSGHIEARQHAEALAENAARDAVQAGELELLTAAQIEAIEAAELEQAHVAALAENAERTRLHGILAHHLEKALGEGALDRAVGQEILDSLGPDVSDLQGAIERVRGLRVAHAEALAEDAERSVLHDRLRHALAEGALDRAGGQAVLDRLVGADAAGIRSAVADVAELRAELAELVASETDQQTVELDQLAAVQAVQADDLVDQYNQRLARLGLHQLPDLDLGDPATLIHHDDEPQWLEVENRDGEVLGYWSDDPDAQWRFDHDADDWVEYDPGQRPSSGPRLG